MVIRGGENIYPTEVENFLYKHPKIEDVQVYITLVNLVILEYSENISVFL